MKKKTMLLGAMSLAAVTFLSACSTGSENQGSNDISDSSIVEDGSSMSSMAHDDSGDIPAGLQEANNPTYQVGDTVTITEGHMEGMEGAEAKIIGAFDTIAYEISYDPTDGGPREENHKWVIQEEISNVGEEVLEPGAEVTVEANHTAGMEGAIAVIEAAEETTVYMIDYQPTTGGETVKNHKWVTDSELSAE